MLSEEIQKKIEAEERFRHELKLKLEAQLASAKSAFTSLENTAVRGEKKVSSKIMEFLNTSVGGLFLSSVVITGGAAMLQKIQHNYETEQKSKAQLIAYQFEIGTRIQNMRYFLTQAKTVGDAKLALASVFQSKFPLNPELEKQSLSALFFNLHQLIKGSEKEKTKRAMEVVLKLEQAEYALQSKQNNQLLDANDKEKLMKLVAAIESMHISEPVK
jgi:actin-related protein